jgi:hypothetical protein
MLSNVDITLHANGVPHIDRPNLRWSISAEQCNNRLLKSSMVNLGAGYVPGLLTGLRQLFVRVRKLNVVRPPVTSLAAVPSLWLANRRSRDLEFGLFTSTHEQELLAS